MACNRRRRLGQTVPRQCPGLGLDVPRGRRFGVTGRRRPRSIDDDLVGRSSRTPSGATSPPLASNRVGSPSVLESLQSTPRFLAQGIGTESSREESNRSPAMNPITESSMVNETLVDHRSQASSTARPSTNVSVEHAGAKKSVMGRLVIALMLVAALIGGGVFGLYKMRVDIPALNTSKLYAHLDSLSVHVER